MNRQVLFSLKNNFKELKISSATILLRALRVNIFMPHLDSGHLLSSIIGTKLNCIQSVLRFIHLRFTCV